MQRTSIIKDSMELRKAIAENPELPIAVMVGREAAFDEYGYTYCEVVRSEVGEILDCYTPWNEGIIYTDRMDFEEALSNHLCDNPKCLNMSDEEFDKVLEEEKAKYEPYWKKAIIVTADNN